MSGFSSQGGFGAPSTNQFFGSQTPNQSQFGTAAPAPGFTGGFGTPVANAGGNTFGAAFGSGGTPAATPFGASSTMATMQASAPPFGSSGFGASPAVPLGAPTPPPASAGFGQSPFGAVTQTQMTGFGTNTTPASGFGSSQSTFGAPSSGFGSQQQQTSQTNSHFGGDPSTTPMTAPNPFGAPSSSMAPAPAISFGMSSNVVPAPVSSTGGAGAPSASPFGGVSSSGFGASSTTTGFPSSTSGFGATAPSMGSGFASSGPFGAASTITQVGNDDMMGDEGNTSAISTPVSAPFSAPTGVPFGATTTGTSQWPPISNQSLRPVPESLAMGDSSMSPTPASGDGAKKEEDDKKLAKLKARIEAKKKKLEEKRRVEGASAGPNVPSTSASSAKLNPTAQSFAPSSPAPLSSERSSSLAERNAERFAASKTTKATVAYLPDDLKQRSAGDLASAYKGRDGDASHDLSSAVSLVGVCPHMCPDDELLRREREGDIQLLETPQPGKLHPQDWTLRNTAVKRFRRSAADYKLDVPEWVRPPDVLENVCGYLEEWVMERDRQGPDPRFLQSGCPPSLDVYQFIWDRTRMVRKDFILQNYVGTGGNCDARAVRCHERIARWHTMCEHQLSHIADFVTMQSQQNIQELGQTMKTLNQYYDDSLGRSVVEIPDDNGNETVKSWTNRRHGCCSDHIMGQNPVDFDGTALRNDPGAGSQRLIGACPDSPTHGTAEPEMRGLYILLTINNEGGMEVLRYAAYLFRERPDVYHSSPVQLALRIYKAKKEYNYSRFFSILRSESTPYLFACIMFKHVEQMRKIAFRIMSKTYGARRKDTGEAVYDSYPLKHLVRLLCFEDRDEARASCRHFNITVKEMEVASSSSPSKKAIVEAVFWRQSDFKEPKDPEKGFVLPLRPKKMIRIIESKLNGTTRLGVCRGQVSGEGAALTKPVTTKQQVIPLTTEEEAERMRLAEVVRAAAKKADEEQLRQRTEEDAKRRMAENRRQRAEEKRLEEENRRLAEAAREKLEKEQFLVQELRKKQEAEDALRQAEAERKKEEEMEAARRAAEVAVVQEKRRQLQEEKLRAAEVEAARRKAELDELERKRQEEVKRLAAEKERVRLEDLGRKRKAAERERLRQLEIKRQLEEQERQRQATEARELALAWEQKINRARKALLWKRIRFKMESRLQFEKSRTIIGSIDPTFSDGPRTSSRLVQDDVYVSDSDVSLLVSRELSTEREPHSLAVIGKIARKKKSPFDLSRMLVDAFSSAGTSSRSRMVLVKLAVVLPDFRGSEADCTQELVHSWIGRRLQYGLLETSPGSSLDCTRTFSVDVLALRHGRAAYSDYDAALLVVPPYFGAQFAEVNFPPSELPIPRVVLDMDDGSNVAYSVSVRDAIEQLRGVAVISVGGNRDDTDYDEALWESCSALMEEMVQADSVLRTRSNMVRMPLFQLAVRCIRASLWSDLFVEDASEEDQVVHRTHATLEAMTSNLQLLADEYESNAQWQWPSLDFADETGTAVQNFFGRGVDLPLSWKESLRREQVAPQLKLQFKALRNASFVAIVEALLDGAPPALRENCHKMLSQRQARRCLESLLLWRETKISSSESQPVLYLPAGAAEDLVARLSKAIPRDNPYTRFELRRNPDSWEAHPLTKTPKREGKQPEGDETNDATSLSGTERWGESAWTPSSTVGVQTPQSLVIPPADTPQIHVPRTSASMKRTRLDMGEESPVDSKRQRDTSILSRNENDSNVFTKKLESLLHGVNTFNFKVGDSSLTELLQDAPSIELPGRLSSPSTRS